MIFPPWLTAITCHFSYPLNSERARPFGTCTLSLFCWAMATPPNAASVSAAIKIRLEVKVLEMRDMVPLHGYADRRRPDMAKQQPTRARTRMTNDGKTPFAKPTTLGGELGSSVPIK